jgi:hypothetical protein
MHVSTDPQLGNIFFNSVKLISMSTNSSRYKTRTSHIPSQVLENIISAGICALGNPTE